MKTSIIAAVLFSIPVTYVVGSHHVASVRTTAYEAGVIEGRRLANEEARPIIDAQYNAGVAAGHTKAVLDRIKQESADRQRREEWQALLSR